MATMVSERRPTFGTNCVRCGNELIAPEKSEYRHGSHIRHLWLCPRCSTGFESIESIPIDVMTSDDSYLGTLLA